jgi:hypothetical protein
VDFAEHFSLERERSRRRRLIVSSGERRRSVGSSNTKYLLVTVVR